MLTITRIADKWAFVGIEDETMTTRELYAVLRIEFNSSPEDILNMLREFDDNGSYYMAVFSRTSGTFLYCE